MSCEVIIEGCKVGIYLMDFWGFNGICDDVDFSLFYGQIGCEWGMDEYG